MMGLFYTIGFLISIGILLCGIAFAADTWYNIKSYKEDKKRDDERWNY